MAELMKMYGADTRQQFWLSVLMTFGVFGVMFIYLRGLAATTPFIEGIVLLMVREWIGTLSFWYTSSAGSKQKDMAQQVREQQQPPKPPPPPS